MHGSSQNLQQCFSNGKFSHSLPFHSKILTLMRAPRIVSTRLTLPPSADVEMPTCAHGISVLKLNAADAGNETRTTSRFASAPIDAPSSSWPIEKPLSGSVSGAPVSNETVADARRRTAPSGSTVVESCVPPSCSE